MSDTLVTVEAMRTLVERWENAPPNETVFDGSDAILEALTPLIAPVDVRPLATALAANDNRAYGTMFKIRALASKMLTELLDWIETLAARGAGTDVLGRLPFIEKFAQSVGERRALARAEYLRGYTLRRQVKLPGAIAAYHRALELAPAEDHQFRSVTYGRLANAQRETGDCDGAIKSYASALAVEPAPAGRAALLRNSATAFRDLGELGEARLREKEAGELLAGAAPDGFALDQAAQDLAAAKDFDQALELNKRAASFFLHGYRLARAVNAYIRSRLLLEAGKPDEAAVQFRGALELFRIEADANVDAMHYARGFDLNWKTRLPEDHAAWISFHTAHALRRSGRLPQAMTALEESAKRARQDGDEALALRAEALLGNWFFDIGDLSRARTVLEQTQAEASRLGIALPEISALVTLASVSQSGADARQDALVSLTRAMRLRDVMALILASRPLTEMQRILELNDTGALENQLGQFATGMRLWKEAADFFESAVAKAEALGDLGTAANRLAGVRWAATKGGDIALSEKTAERLRVLLNRPNVPPRGRIVGGRTLADYERERNPAICLHWLGVAMAASEEIRASVPIGKRGGLERQSSDLFWRLPEALRLAGRTTEAFDALQLGKARDLSEIASIRAGGNGAPLRLKEVQAKLGPGDALLDISYERDGLVGYLVDRQKLKIVNVDGDSAALTAPDQGDLRTREASMLDLVRGSELLKKFASSVENEMPTDGRLLIVPEPHLNNLPLHAIPVGGRPWCEVRRMGLLPAAGVLVAPRVQQQGRAFVAGNSLGDLPGAEAECHAVAKFYGVTARTRSGCTEAALRDALASGPLDVVHLATHGRGNPRRGGQASLLMADDSGGTHWVDIDRLMEMTWNVGLVVLSGCSTGLVGRKDGYELVSVAGQILGAGAGAVIACLWPVGDTAAETAMVAFHDAFLHRAGRDVWAALDAGRAALRMTAAPVARVRDGRNVSPEGPRLLAPEVERDLNWSAFVAFGAPDPFS
jgi:CHAT domain-containing protein/tetratricopeptide (TPR) repeat protein